MISCGVFRIILAASSALAIGSLYNYASLHRKLTHVINDQSPIFPPKPEMVDSLLYASVVALCWLILATLINQYVSYKQLAPLTLLRMAVELWLMAACIQLPNVDFASLSTLYGFCTDQLWNLAMVLTMTFVLGFKRFNGCCPMVASVNSTPKSKFSKIRDFAATMKNSVNKSKNDSSQNGPVQQQQPQNGIVN